MIRLIAILSIPAAICFSTLMYHHNHPPLPSNSLSSTPTFAPTPDRFLTATAIIAAATEIAVNVTMTAAADNGISATTTHIPALSTGETEALRYRWLSELEAAAGFSHPVFVRLVDSLVEDAVAAIVYQNQNGYGNGSEVRRLLLQPEVEHAKFDGKFYVAVITISEFVTSSPMPHSLFLFHISEGVPILLSNPIEDNRFLFGSEITFDRDGQFPGGFGDRNANGVPDLLVHSSDFVGSSGCIDWGTPMLLEFQADGSFADITPYSHSFPWLKPAGVLDLDHDGILEFRMRDDMGTPLLGDRCELELIRYYGWNGKAYVDISPSLPETLWPGIEAFWRSIEEEKGCILPSLEMYQALLDYEARGQLATGWQRIQSTLRWDLCSPESLERNKRDMNDLIEWISSRFYQFED